MIHTVAATGSTNADLIAQLREGEFVPEGDWLVADRQTAGRGRLGRDWFDGTGNFMGSTMVHRRFGDPPAPSLALLAGLAVQAAVVPLLSGKAEPLLKWPNDIMVGPAKLAGILLEAQVDSVVIGIGVNLLCAPALPDRPAIAVGDITAAPDRDAFAAALAAAFDTELERWRTVGLAPLIRRWLAVAHPVGTPLKVTGASGEPPLAGRFAGLDANGGLQLLLPDGTTLAVHAGDVMLAGPHPEGPA